MIPQLNMSDFRGYKVRNDRRSYELLLDGDNIGIFINPQTDFIKQSALNLAMLSNTVIPQVPTEPEEIIVPEIETTGGSDGVDLNNIMPPEIEDIGVEPEDI